VDVAAAEIAAAAEIVVVFHDLSAAAVVDNTLHAETAIVA